MEKKAKAAEVKQRAGRASTLMELERFTAETNLPAALMQFFSAASLG
jgi:hypothetical protein